MEAPVFNPDAEFEEVEENNIDNAPSFDESKPFEEYDATEEISTDTEEVESEPIDFIAKEEQKAKDSKAKLLTLIDENPDMSEYYQKAYDNIDESLENKKVEIKQRELKKITLDKQIADASEKREPLEDRVVSSTKDISSRIDTGLGTAQGQARVNMLSPLAEFLGMEETAKELKIEGETQIEAGKKIEEEYKKKYGEDRWNIAQSVGEYAPDAVMSVLMGAKNIPSAIGESAVTYARTGDIKTSAVAGVTSLIGNKIINDLFDVGTKAVKTKFGKEIAELTVDEQKNVNKAFDALDDMNITSLDAEAREKVIAKLDLTKSTEDISSAVKKELKGIAKTEYSKVKDAYDVADDIASKSGRKTLNLLEIRNIAKDNKIIIDKKQSKAIKSVFELVDNEANGLEMESVLKKLKELNRAKKHKTGSNDPVYNIAIDYVQGMQDEVLDGAYDEARNLSRIYNTKFKGVIEGEGSDLGREITEASVKDVRFNLGSRLLGDKIDPELAKDIKNLNLSTNAKEDLVKDVLTRGLDKDEIATKDSVNTIITNWNKSDKNGLKQLLGKKYNTVDREMKALEVIQNTLDESPEDLSIKKNVINFLANASMVKISPVYAGKGIIYEGRNIATKVAFKKQKDVIKKRILEIPDSKVRDKIARAFYQATIGFTSSELDKMFKDTNQED